VAGGAVGSFHSAEPDARVFPLYTPRTSLLGEAAGELDIESIDENRAPTTIAPEWVQAAAQLVEIRDERTAGEAVFFALFAVMNSPKWISDQPAEMDDFPQVPLPSDPSIFEDAVATGKQLVMLFDPDREVDGVTRGVILDSLRRLAVEDSVAGLIDLEFGQAGQRAGLYENRTVYWNADHGWRNVPPEVWNFSACGFQVLPKWLSYRKHGGLTSADRRNFRMLARRIQRIIDLESSCDDLYSAALADPLLASSV
jgi:hypothetical protein